LRQSFQSAIQDASVAEPYEISRNLLAIVPYQDGLLWDGEAGHSRVLMATWTSWTGYDAQVGKSIPVDILLKSIETSRDVWVSPANEMAAAALKCRHLPFNHRVLRMEQFLGLPPNGGKTRFVEFWVDPDDLFRPAPDPEITDHEASLDYPRSSRFVTVSESHQQWMASLIASSYSENGYPWTRLGYTYDWGNLCSHVGLSEFVIRSGASVTVRAVTLNEYYLN